jgi:hypothetical protein
MAILRVIITTRVRGIVALLRLGRRAFLLRANAHISRREAELSCLPWLATKSSDRSAEPPIVGLNIMSVQGAISVAAAAGNQYTRTRTRLRRRWKGSESFPYPTPHVK